MYSKEPNAIFARLDTSNDIHDFVFTDSYGERKMQIDVKGAPHNGILPHNHLGFVHGEDGFREPTPKEAKIISDTLAKWEVKRKKLGL